MGKEDLIKNPNVERAFVKVTKALQNIEAKPLEFVLALNSFVSRLYTNSDSELGADDYGYAMKELVKKHQLKVTKAQVKKMVEISAGFVWGKSSPNLPRGSIFRDIFWDSKAPLISEVYYYLSAAAISPLIDNTKITDLKNEAEKTKLIESFQLADDVEDKQTAEDFLKVFTTKENNKSQEEILKFYLKKVDKLDVLVKDLKIDIDSKSYKEKISKVAGKVFQQARSSYDKNLLENMLSQIVDDFEADLTKQASQAGEEKFQQFQEGLAKLHMEEAKHKRLEDLAKEKLDSGEALNKKKLRKLYIKEVSDVLKEIVSEYKFLKPAVRSLKEALKAYEGKFEKAVREFFEKPETERNLKEFLLDLEVMTDDFKHQLVKDALPDNYNIDSPQEFKHALVLLLLKQTLLNEAQQEGLVIAEVDTHAKHLHRLSKKPNDKASVKGDALLELANDLKITKNIYTGEIRDAKFTNAADYMKLREGFKDALKEKIKAKLSDNPNLSKHRRWATKMGTFVLNLSMVVFSGGIAFGVGIARKLMGKSFLRSFHTTTEKLLTKPGKAKDAAKGTKWDNVDIKKPSIK